ncbi:MAG TPA: LLM class flavin-dependent oxidoreductase [Acidimicrobiales bacterium]|nr:LLM class flavin-dependent oxidoreductase [Acidimicrobiales bacterium]
MAQQENGPATPFQPGSVSLRLYPHNDLDATGIVGELCGQGRLALEGGFDGIMTSEHHGGVGGYLPNPLQMAGFVLEDTPRGWAAPCPLLLPLRPTALVAEEVAWLAARHPGRVGVGVGSGALALDFDVMGLQLADASPAFKAELPRIVQMLRGEELGDLAGDRALQRCSDQPIPVLSAAVSVAAARRAARCGAGIILEGMSGPERVAELCTAYDEAGGVMPKILIRRVWLGPPQSNLVDQQRQFYQSYRAEETPMPADQTISVADGAEMGGILAEVMKSSGADGLNLRIHLPGMAPAAIREQIAGLVSDVLPRLRSEFKTPSG